MVALSSVSEMGTDGVIVNGTCGATTLTTTLVTTLVWIAVTLGGTVPINAAVLSDGDLVVANADISNSTAPNLVFEISTALGFVGSSL